MLKLAGAMNHRQNVNLVRFDSVDDPVGPPYYLTNIFCRLLRDSSAGLRKGGDLLTTAC